VTETLWLAAMFFLTVLAAAAIFALVLIVGGVIGRYTGEVGLSLYFIFLLCLFVAHIVRT